MRIALLTAVGLLAGCGGSAGDSSLWDKIYRLQDENNQLQARADKLESENQQLLEQCQALDFLDRQIRLSALDRLDRIEIGKHTRLTDENGDGRLDALTVHVIPIDQAEDTVKTPGSMEVSLWQLDPHAEEHLLGQWTVTAQQARTLWGRSLLGRYYRLKFDLPSAAQNHPDDLTVKVTFTDYLTGKTLQSQKTLGPR